jgi:bacteriorhodopsin
MRRAFAGLATLLVLVVVAQFFLAASGAFSASPNDESFAPHRALGWVAFALPVVLAVVGALARVPGRLIGLAALVAGLVSVQVLIAKLADGLGDTSTAGQLLFGLHGIGGLAILAVTGTIVRRSWALARAAASSADAVSSR